MTIRIPYRFAALVCLATVLAVCAGAWAADSPAPATPPAPAAAAPTPVAPAPVPPAAAPAPVAPAPVPAAAAPVPAAPAASEIVARIEGEVVTRKDFDSSVAQYEMRMRSQQQSGDGSMPPAAPPALTQADREKILDRIIDDKIVGILAKKAAVAVTDDEVNGVIADMKQRAGTAERFQSFLARQGITEAEVLAKVREGMMSRKFVEQKMKEYTPTADEIKTEYGKLVESGALKRGEESVDVAHVLVLVKGKEDAAWEEGKKKIDAAHARVKGGEDFAKVAKEVSEDPGSKDKGGLYPNVTKGKMVPEFDKLAFETAVGGLTEPFRTDYGWHFLTVKAKHEAGSTVTLEEISSDVATFIQQKKGTEALEKLIADAKPTLKIEKALPPAPQPEVKAPAAPAQGITLPAQPDATAGAS